MNFTSHRDKWVYDQQDRLIQNGLETIMLILIKYLSNQDDDSFCQPDAELDIVLIKQGHDQSHWFSQTGLGSTRSLDSGGR